MRDIIAVLLVLFSLRSTSVAQEINVLKLDSLFNILSERTLAMGSICISRDGKDIYQRSIGYAYIDSSKKIPANNTTKYRIGSGSKMFTAVMIFQLAEEGKIGLDAKLDAYFPSLPNATKITISNLLNHRSGLHDYTEDTNFQQWMDKPVTHDSLLKIIAQKGARFEPGTKSEYCNSNYVLLSYIIEKIDKIPYDSALIKRIVSGISLPNTGYGRPVNTNNNESFSYKYFDNHWKQEKQTDMSIHSGAGSIMSTAPDMTKFIEALFHYKLVSKASLNRMTTLVDGYGMGLFPLNHGVRFAYGHNGRIEEFYSSARYFPKEKLSVAYITNGIVYPRIDLLDGILKICFNEPFTIPFTRSITLTSADLDQYLGTYSSGQMPVVVTCIKEHTKLLLKANENILEVVPINNHYFMHAPSGSFFEFNPAKGELLIKETDNVYYLKKK